MISDKEMRKRIADMPPQELLKASETFEALFDLVHQHDDNSIANTNPDYYKQEPARHDEYISKLEAKIPKLNIDLAEASTHAYNSESARMKLEAELSLTRCWGRG